MHSKYIDYDKYLKIKEVVIEVINNLNIDCKKILNGDMIKLVKNKEFVDSLIQVEYSLKKLKESIDFEGLSDVLSIFCDSLKYINE